MNIIDTIIPGQQTGWESNTEEKVSAATREEAERLYDLAKSRLLDVNQWHELKDMPATFSLTDGQGNRVEGPAKPNLFFKISIPSPKTDSGDGFDWVQVEDVSEISDAAADRKVSYIIVHPAPNPTTEKNDDASHFFSPEASSCFVVARDKSDVIAAVYGRNEKPNVGTESLLDKARNVIVAIGAAVGMSKIQWKSLVKGLLS